MTKIYWDFDIKHEKLYENSLSLVKEEIYVDYYINNVYNFFYKFCLVNLGLGDNIYWIQTNSKIDINFKYDELFTIINESYSYNHAFSDYPENIRLLKQYFCYDMHLIDSLKNLSFFIIIPKYEKDKFYYDILIGFKNEFNLEILKSLNFKCIYVKKINQMYDFAGYLSEHEPKINLSENVFKDIFDFRFNIFNNISFEDELSTLTQLNKQNDINFKSESNYSYYLHHYKKEMFRLICMHFNIYNNSTDAMICFFLDTINNHLIHINLNSLFLKKF